MRDDPALREAFRRGERRALETAYRHYLPLVRTVVVHGFGGFRGFRNPCDQDDAIQTIFATAFGEGARDRYNGLDPYASYLRGIAHNVVRQLLDKRRRFERVPDPDPGEPMSLEEGLLERETCAILCRFRDSLGDERERAVLELYFAEGWAEERLAAHLGITRYRLRKVIGKLHKRMKRYLETHGIVGV